MWKQSKKQFSSLFILTAADPLSSHLPRCFNVLHCPPHSYSCTRTHIRNTHRPTHPLTQLYEDHISLGLPFLSASAQKVWSLVVLVRRWGTFLNQGWKVLAWCVLLCQIILRLEGWPSLGIPPCTHQSCEGQLHQADTRFLALSWVYVLVLLSLKKKMKRL